MKPVELSEIKNIADYEIERETLRPRMIELKGRRRIRVGDHMTFLFENRDTVRYQVQEMMRIERIVKPQDVAHELETYNELIPGKGELCATLLIEYETPAERDVALKNLLGLEDHIWIEAGGARAHGVFDDRQIGDTRLSSVQYVRFKLSQPQIDQWDKHASVIVSHPHYSAIRELTPVERQELAQDFA